MSRSSDGSIDWKRIGAIIAIIVILIGCVSYPVMVYHYADKCSDRGGEYRTLRSDARGLCITPDGRLIPNP